MLKKIKKFKIGDIVSSEVEMYRDNMQYQNDSDLVLASREITRRQETLLILAHDGNNSFIVTPLGENIFFSQRKYFSYGGFDKCFKLLVSYVNKNCTSVS
jgi:hypothetical protein